MQRWKGEGRKKDEGRRMEENGRKWYQIGCDMVGCDNLSSNADTIATIEFPSVHDSGNIQVMGYIMSYQ